MAYALACGDGFSRLRRVAPIRLLAASNLPVRETWCFASPLALVVCRGFLESPRALRATRNVESHARRIFGESDWEVSVTSKGTDAVTLQITWRRTLHAIWRNASWVSYVERHRTNPVNPAPFCGRYSGEVVHVV